MEHDDLKIRLHGNFALKNYEVSTLCGTIEAFRASLRLAETLSIEGLEVLRDYVKEHGKDFRGSDREIRQAFAAYLEHLIHNAKERDRRAQHSMGLLSDYMLPPTRPRNHEGK